jgi:hypothetical protein
MTKHGTKCAAEHFFYIFFLSKIATYLPIPWPPYRTSKLQEKPSALKREHPALQNMKFLNFFIFLGHFCPPGSGSTGLIASGFNSYPELDPKYCFLERKKNFPTFQS